MNVNKANFKRWSEMTSVTVMRCLYRAKLYRTVDKDPRADKPVRWTCKFTPRYVIVSMVMPILLPFLVIGGTVVAIWIVGSVLYSSHRSGIIRTVEGYKPSKYEFFKYLDIWNH